MEYMERSLLVRVIVCILLLLQLNYPYCERGAKDCLTHIFIPHTALGDTMATRGAWANDFLHALGNAAPSEDTQKLVAAWTRAENTQAKNNPLATTFNTDNATQFNSAGVKNYPTREEGINASVRTLQGNFPGYGALEQALKNNDPARALASGGFDTWGSHTSAVLILYNAGDFRNEPLKSEETGSVSGGSWDTQQEPTPQRALPDVSKAQSTELITEQDVRLIAKQFLGIVFIGIGGLLFVIAIIKTDTAQSAIQVAAKAII